MIYSMVGAFIAAYSVVGSLLHRWLILASAALCDLFMLSKPVLFGKLLHGTNFGFQHKLQPRPLSEPLNSEETFAWNFDLNDPDLLITIDSPHPYTDQYQLFE